MESQDLTTLSRLNEVSRLNDLSRLIEESRLNDLPLPERFDKTYVKTERRGSRLNDFPGLENAKRYSVPPPPPSLFSHSPPSPPVLLKIFTIFRRHSVTVQAKAKHCCWGCCRCRWVTSWFLGFC